MLRPTERWHRLRLLEVQPTRVVHCGESGFSVARAMNFWTSLCADYALVSKKEKVRARERRGTGTEYRETRSKKTREWEWGTGEWPVWGLRSAARHVQCRFHRALPAARGSHQARDNGVRRG